MAVAGLPYLMDAQPGEPYDWYLLQQVIAAINGYEDYGVPWVLSETDIASQAAVIVRNKNPLGSALAVYSPTDELELVVDEDGVGIQSLYIAHDLEVQEDVQVHGNVGIEGSTTHGGWIFLGASAGIDFDDGVGTKIILGNAGYAIGIDTLKTWISSGGGIHALYVKDGASYYEVMHTGNDGHLSGFDADLLDGQHGSYYATAADLDLAEAAIDALESDVADLQADVSAIESVIGALADAYVDEAGDTMSGRLNVALANDQAIGVRHTSSSEAGYWTIGATSTADPAMVFKSHGGHQALLLADLSYTYQVEVYNNLFVNGQIEVNGLSQFDDTVNVTAGGIEIDAGGLVVNGTATFQDPVAINSTLAVDGSSNLGNSVTDSVTCAGSISVGGPSSVFLGEVSFFDTIHLSAHTIDFDLGGTTDFTRSSWHGYVTVRHDGVDKYLPYTDSPPS